MRRLLIVSTHPIQYHTPWYQALSQHPDIALTVYFCHRASAQEQGAAGFGVNFEWDIPLLEGYRYEFLTNIAREPSIAHFNGLDTPEIFDRLRAERFDAVIVSGWNYKAAWQTFFACWSNRIPVMVRGDSHLHTRRNLPKRIAKYLFYRAFLSRMDAALAVGKWSSEYYAHYGVPKDRISVVPHVVDEDRFFHETSMFAGQQAELRKLWNIDEDAVVFMFCGKLIEQKHPLDFIQAVLIARQSNDHIVGLVVGDGPLRKAAEAATGPSRNTIVFAGFQNQSQLPSMYALSDVIVLPSNAEETWGLVINEAMLSGLPAIVSDQVGCGPDLVIPGVTGSVFPIGDVEALAQLMVNYAEQPQKIRSMGANAQKHVLDHYGIRQAVNGVIESLEYVITR